MHPSFRAAEMLAGPSLERTTTFDASRYLCQNEHKVMSFTQTISFCETPTLVNHDQRHAGYTAGRETMIEHDEIHRGGHNWNQVEEAGNVY